jgi:hypothetical protein
MGSPFDLLQTTVFDNILNVFGVEAEWEAADKGASFVGRVLFNNPTEPLRLQGFEFDPTKYEIEFREGQFPGLKERVDSRKTTEFVFVDGSRYAVLAIVMKYDGKTIRASVQPSPE